MFLLQSVSASELLDRARKGLVTVLDVRPPKEFAPARSTFPSTSSSRAWANCPYGAARGCRSSP